MLWGRKCEIFKPDTHFFCKLTRILTSQSPLTGKIETARSINEKIGPSAGDPEHSHMVFREVLPLLKIKPIARFSL